MKKRLILICMILSVLFSTICCNTNQLISNADTVRMAIPSQQAIVCNGEEAYPTVYSIDDRNYLKLRDVAALMDFDVVWDGETSTVSIFSKESYSGEYSPKVASESKQAYKGTSDIYIDGRKVEGLSAYIIEDNNYFSVRELAQAVDFGLIFNAEKNAVELSDDYGYSPDDKWGEDRRWEETSTIVHFFDTGCSDSIFIEFPGEKDMLIDAADNNDSELIVSKIKGYGYHTIDYVVATHPHADHIGAMDEVIEEMNIGTIYLPDADYDTKTYKELLSLIDEKDINSVTAKAGVNIYKDSAISFDILAPHSSKYSDLNNYSAVVKMVYKDSSFLFTGDASKESEEEMLNSGVNLKSDLIKVGHHGSKTASSEKFVNAVGAKYAIVTAGVTNKYSLPDDIVLNRWSGIGAKIYRVGIMGEITAISDGKNINVICEKAA